MQTLNPWLDMARWVALVPHSHLLVPLP